MRRIRAQSGLLKSLVGSVATGAVLLTLAVPATATPLLRTATDPTTSDIVNGVVPPLDPNWPRGLRLGVDVPTGLYEVPPIEAFDAATGYRTDVVQGFVGWEYTGHADWSEFPTYRIRDIVASGRIPQITWNPGLVDGPVDQPAYALRTITAGNHDAYLTRFAQAARAINSRIQIRFGHEMNGTWNTYAENHSGNTPGDFIKAWRHIHDLFAREGATNIDWVWSPNILENSQTTNRNLYPGDDYVDWVGIDGYSYPLSGCPTAATLFGPTMTDMLSFSTKRVMIAETAVAEECGNKATWIKGLFTWAATQPRLELIIWWQRSDPGRNWLFDSSTTAAQEMRTQLQLQAARTTAAPNPTPPVNQPPVAAFTATMNYLTITANNSTSTDAEGPLAAIAWAFGDGTVGTGITTTHTYAVPGTYTVTLTVTDEAGSTGTAIQQMIATAPPAPIPTPEMYVTHVYRDLLARAPSTTVLATWSTSLRAGAPRIGVPNSITGSDEYRNLLIASAYQSYLDRKPDSTGKAIWLKNLRAGSTVQQMEAALLASGEYFTKSGANNTTWIRSLYARVLGRTAATSEVDWWVKQLRYGRSRTSVATSFVLSTEHLSILVDGYYRALLGRSVELTVRSTLVTSIQSGTRVQAILGGIIASDEYLAKS